MIDVIGLIDLVDSCCKFSVLVVLRCDHICYAVKVCIAKQLVYAYRCHVSHEAF